jgi:hypothetical protein
MCAEFDFEVICKRLIKRKEHLIFINFGVKMFLIRGETCFPLDQQLQVSPT